MNEKELFKGFKALAEPSRLQIIKILSLDAACVCELSEVLNMSQPRVSQHLRTLKEAGLVTEQKESNWVFYSFNREALNHLLQNLDTFLHTALHDLPGYQEISSRYEYLPFNEKIRETKAKLKHSEVEGSSQG